jgi:hypothetical protein
MSILSYPTWSWNECFDKNRGFDLRITRKMCGMRGRAGKELASAQNFPETVFSFAIGLDLSNLYIRTRALTLRPKTD